MSERYFFTADNHFGHQGILKHQTDTRPYSSVEEMDEEMIQLWNETVRPGDVVRVIGDFSFHGWEKTGEILDRLNGQKILIIGNHDKSSLSGQLKKKWSGRMDYARIRFPLSNGERQHAVTGHVDALERFALRGAPRPTRTHA